MNKPPVDKTDTGLPEDSAGMLCYILFFLSGIAFLMLERRNRFIRFHAMQSILVFGGLWVLYFLVRQVFQSLPIVANIAGWVIGAIAIVLWILLMVKAYQGIRFKLPWWGNLADRYSGQ